MAASKTITGKNVHEYKGAVDLLTKDATLTDRQRAGLQAAAQDMYAALDGLNAGARTITVTADVFGSTTVPSMTMSMVFS